LQCYFDYHIIREEWTDGESR